MTTTPARLFGPAQLTASAATKYTVPGATTAILRHIHVYNPGPAAATFTLSIGADAAGVRLYDAHVIQAGGEFDRICLYVLAAAEIVQAFASITTQLVMTLDGELRT